MIGSDNLCVDSKTRIQKAASVLKNGKKSVYLPTILRHVRRQGSSNGGMVDTRDLKSLDHCGCAGSSPASSTSHL